MRSPDLCPGSLQPVASFSTSLERFAICPTFPFVGYSHVLPSSGATLGALGQDSFGWLNPCGGMRWRTNADGRIELEDGSVPEYAPGSVGYKQVEQTWNNFSGEFENAAYDVDLPIEWLVGIATSETGFLSGNKEKQRTVESQDGYSSIGVMQPLPSVARIYGYSADDRFDAQKNIEIGAKVLQSNNLRTSGGFPVVAAMYNGGQGRGGCNIGNDVFNLKGYRGAYVTGAIKNMNTAAGIVGAGGVSKLAIAAGIGLVGVGVATAVMLLR